MTERLYEVTYWYRDNRCTVRQTAISYHDAKGQVWDRIHYLWPYDWTFSDWLKREHVTAHLVKEGAEG